MGMMGGMGSGMGMMGGMGSGMGMMGLDEKQRGKVRAINRDLRKKRWSLMGQIMDESDKLYALYDASPRDAKAIGKVYSRIFDLKRQIIEASIVAGNKSEGVLTKEQRDRMGDMMGRGGRMGGMGMMGR